MSRDPQSFTTKTEHIAGITEGSLWPALPYKHTRIFIENSGHSKLKM